MSVGFRHHSVLTRRSHGSTLVSNGNAADCDVSDLRDRARKQSSRVFRQEREDVIRANSANVGIRRSGLHLLLAYRAASRAFRLYDAVREPERRTVYWDSRHAASSFLDGHQIDHSEYVPKPNSDLAIGLSDSEHCAKNARSRLVFRSEFAVFRQGITAVIREVHVESCDAGQSPRLRPQKANTVGRFFF